MPRITGDCLGSWRGGGIPGVDTYPQFATEWNHDGDDSTPTWLLVGAEGMTTAGNTDVLAWAAWDGATWHSILGDIPDFVWISSPQDVVRYPIAIDPANGDLWYHTQGALKHRTSTTGLWTSTPYQVTTSIINNYPEFGINVFSQLVVHQSTPYMLGTIGQQPRGLLRWSGAEWQSVTSLPADSSFARFNLYSLNNQLFLTYAATRNTTTQPCIWQLVENQWQTVGDGLPSAGFIGHLATFNGQLIASDRNIVDQTWILRQWTGTQWQTIPNVSMSQPQFAVKPDGVYYYWAFEGIGFALTRWDGTQAQPFFASNQVISAPLTPFRDGFAARIYTQSVNNFPYYTIEQFCSHLVIFEDNAYSIPGDGFNGNVNTLLAHDGTLYAGGNFARYGETVTGTVARFVNGVWEPVSQTPLRVEVFSLAHWQGNLIAGTFLNTWMLTNGAWQSIGTRPNDLAVYNNDLYRSSSNRVDRYDNGVWTTIMTLQGAPKLRVIDQRLYAIGGFTTVNDLPTEGIASWDGTTVHTFNAPRPLSPEGFPHSAVDLALFQGSFYGVFRNSIYRLEGQAWTKIAGGQFDSDNAGPLISTDDRLYAVIFPWFDSSIGSASHVAAFDGTNWLPVLGWTRTQDFQRVRSLAFLDGQLHLAGDFTSLIDRDYRTLDTPDFAYWAMWTPPAPCDSIDFNNDGSSFDPRDIDAFLSVYSEGPCVLANPPGGDTCNDIDFNNDCSLFDPCDINAFLLVFSEGPCTPCGV